MKRYSKLLTVFMTFVVLLYFLFNTKVVFAAKFHQEGDNVVYKESVTLDDLNENSFTQWGWSPSSGMYVYKIDDKTGIPTGSVINGMCFFKYGYDDKFGAIASSQFITLILNRGLGLVFSDEKLLAFYTAYLQNISGVHNNKAGSLVDSHGNVLGLCLNDISGCVYDAYPQNTNIDIPSQEVNNVYNYYQYYIDVVDPQTPDYINIQTYNLNTVKTLLDVSNQYTASSNSVIDVVGNGLCTFFYSSGNTRLLRYGVDNSYRGMNYYDISNCSCYASLSTTYNNFCNSYGLVNNGDVVGYTKLIATGGYYLDVKFLNADTSTPLSSGVRYKLVSNSDTYTTENITISSSSSVRLCSANYVPCSKNPSKITVYKDSPILTSVVNKTYAPSTYTSNNYNSYNTNADNSISTNTSVVNNSTTTNNEIYNDASESFQEYYSSQDNYNIDNSVVIQNTTEIIYNYYGNDNGGGGSDDNDDDPIWDALLKAIVDFFKKIGQLIAALLTGLLELINTVLDAFANINNSFEGIKNFLSSIFSWFPSEIVTLMVLGLGLALLASFITWFKR